LALIQLSRFASGISQSGKGRAGSGDQAIFTSCESQFSRARTKDKPTIEVAGNKTVMFKCDSKTVGGRAGNSGHSNELCQRVRA
jgi:hypothetical protein